MHKPCYHALPLLSRLAFRLGEWWGGHVVTHVEPRARYDMQVAEREWLAMVRPVFEGSPFYCKVYRVKRLTLDNPQYCTRVVGPDGEIMELNGFYKATLISGYAVYAWPYVYGFADLGALRRYALVHDFAFVGDAWERLERDDVAEVIDTSERGCVAAVYLSSLAPATRAQIAAKEPMAAMDDVVIGRFVHGTLTALWTLSREAFAQGYKPVLEV